MYKRELFLCPAIPFLLTRMISLFLIGLSFLILSCYETPQSFTKKRIKRVEKGLIKAVVIKGEKVKKMKLSDRMEYYKVPGVSIAVIDKYQIEWAKGYGVKETGSSEPITSLSIFQAASLSQAVAASGALHFVERGELDLDADINETLSSWRVPEHELTREKKVTTRGLLSHRAGLIPVEFKGYAQGEALPSLEEILNGKDPANSPVIWVNILPGSKFQYSEAGYVILQQILVDIEKKPFAKIIEETVLAPLQMTRSTFECPLPDELREETVTGHSREGKPVKGKWHNYPEKAASGLWSTPSDLALFAIDIMETAMGKSQRVISPETARVMLTAQVGFAGLGFLIKDKGDILRFLQRGRNEGYESLMVAYPVRGQGAVIMTNSDNGAYLIDEILRGISAVYKWPHFEPEVKTLYRLDPSVYAQYVGTYEVNPDYVLTVTHEDYYLIIQPTGQAPTKFLVESQTTFFSTDPYIKIRFVRDDLGEVTGLTLRQRDMRLEAKKIE